MYSGRVILFGSTILLQITIALAADFPACLPVVQKVQNITTDEIQYFISRNPTRPLLSLAGCEHLCGTGFQFWPADDTLGRLVLWVLPMSVLIAHYHFAPLSVRGKIAVVVHLLGDPVDSLWGVLTRDTVYRQLYRLYEKSELKLAKQIATILAAYEELGWQDASYILREKRVDLGNLTPVQELFIHEASHMLVSNHAESQLGTWISIFALFAALLGAYVRTWTQSLNNQTAHTLAVVSLFFHYIALVKISGNIGAFTTSSAPLHILLNLRRNLPKRCQQCKSLMEPEIFPPVYFHSKTRRKYDPKNLENSLFSLTDDEEPDQKILQWQEMATWLGMNSLWRPRKIRFFKSPNPQEDTGSLQLLLYSLAFVVVGSYLPAFFLSYFTNNFGFGCHDLAWTLILVAWILSIAADEILNRCIHETKLLWSWTIFKDFVVILGIISVILVSQIGLMNSCFCKAKMKTGANAVVDLGPFTHDQYLRGYIPWVSAPVGGFLVTMLLIFIVGRGGEHGRGLLNKSHEERDRELVTLQILQHDLPNEAIVSHFSLTCDKCASNRGIENENVVATEQVVEVAPSTEQPDPEDK